MIAAVLAATVLMAQAAPEAAPPPGKTVSPAVVTAKPAASVDRSKEVVCRRETVLGSLFPKETCATRQEMTERTRLDQQQTRESTNLRPYKLTDGIGP